MASERSTRTQVQAYRFGVRRIEDALVSGRSQAYSLHGPRYGLAALIGLLLTAILLAGFGVLGILRPSPKVGDANVLIDTDSGGAYAMIDGVAHPAMNFTSAMLAAAGDDGQAIIKKINTETLATLRRGQLVGVPGAPNQIPAKKSLTAGIWNVCDETSSLPGYSGGSRRKIKTTVTIGEQVPPALTQEQAMLVSSSGGRYLLWNGHRSRIPNPRDRAIRAALRFRTGDTRPISLGLLNTIPDAGPLKRPRIPGRGKQRTVGTRHYRIGEVLSVAATDRENPQYYVVLGDGVQAISALAADLIRFSWSRTARIVPARPSDVANTPTSTVDLELDGLPEQRPSFVTSDTSSVICFGWSKDQAAISTLGQLPIPGGATAVTAPPATLAQRTSSAVTGRKADAVYLAPGKGLVAAPRLGDGSPSTGDQFLITDQGIAYPLGSRRVAELLQLTGEPTAVPGSILDLIPLGPALETSAARKVRN